MHNHDENILLCFLFFCFLFFFVLFFSCVYVQLYLYLDRNPTIEELAVSLEATSEQIKGYGLLDE